MFALPCFNTSCGMFVYRFEKSKFQTEKALFILFKLLIAVIIASLFCTGHNVLTLKKKKDSV